MQQLQQLQQTRNDKQKGLDAKYPNVQRITMKTATTAVHFEHRLYDERDSPVGPALQVPLKFMLRPDLLGGKAHEIFNSLGCLYPDGNINMLRVNQIKQLLDMIKDGTAIALLKKLKIWDFGRTWGYIRYPETLNLLKEYFFKHFESEGRCNNVFWPRHGDYTGYVLLDELASHDCGFDPKLAHIKGMTDKLDPLSHGTIKNTDVIFPRRGRTMTWDSSTLQALGYPPNCQITAKCTSADVGQHSVWDISVTCANSSGQRILMDSTGIFKLGPNGVKTEKIETKIIKTLEDTIKGNAFKGLTQKGEKETPNNQFIFMGLVFNKSFGDNGFDMDQRALAMLGVPTTIYTCDFTLFLSSITAMTESGAVLTTNHREEPGLPTGNLSIRFRATELPPSQELQSIFGSCFFENNAYLQMLKNLYNEALARRPPSIQIKLGGAVHEVNLWFLVTIIDTIEAMTRNHQQIMGVFMGLQMVTTLPITQEWRTHKQYILQLLKSYCKIVFPFVKKNGEWNVFCQSSLISKFPAPRAGELPQISELMQRCQPQNTANKDALTIKMNDVLVHNHKPISVVKLNMQQYALIVKNKFDIADNASLNLYPMPAPAQGGGRNKRRDSNKIGGMHKNPRDLPTQPSGMKRLEHSPPPGAAGTAHTPLELKKTKLITSEEQDYAVILDTQAKTFFDFGAFTAYINSIELPASSPRSLEINSEMGFSPTAFCDVDNANFFIFVHIKLSDFLSHILKLVSYMITAGINVTEVGAGGGGAAQEAELEAGAELVLQYEKCVFAKHEIQNIFGGEHLHPLWNLADFLDSKLENLKDIQSEVLGHLYSNIKEGYDLFIQKLKTGGINPSSDTIEFAITSFNLTLRGQLQNPDKLIEAYNVRLQSHLSVLGGVLDEETISQVVLLDAESLYENIKNIAYNVFLNHEYVLPLICSEELVTQCYRELISECEINITLPATPVEPVRAGVTGEEVTVATRTDGYSHSPLRDVKPLSPPHWDSPSGSVYGSDGSQVGFLQEESDPDSLQVPVSPSKTGGSSTRTRRNHRRTQYTNKHKRSSKSTKHATIKHRKSYRKHNRTIKRRKSHRRK